MNETQRMQETREKSLWSKVTERGVKAYAEGGFWLTDRPFSNLTEVLGIGTHEGLSRMLAMSGVEAALITGDASDYDKLSALGDVIPLWSGHPYVSAISRLTETLLGEPAPLCHEALPELWTRTAEVLGGRSVTSRSMAADMRVSKMCVSLSQGEGSPCEGAWLSPILRVADPLSLWTHLSMPALSQATAATDMIAAAGRLLEEWSACGGGGVEVSLGEVAFFVRPNPYTPGQAVYRLRRGESLSVEEACLVAAQTLRIIGEGCVKRGMTLTLTDPRPEVLDPLVGYLKGCGCLPHTQVVTRTPAEALTLGLKPLLRLPAVPAGHTLTALWEDTASAVPLGRLGGLYMPLTGIMDLAVYLSAAEDLCGYIEATGYLHHPAAFEILT